MGQITIAIETTPARPIGSQVNNTGAIFRINGNSNKGKSGQKAIPDQWGLAV